MPCAALQCGVCRQQGLQVLDAAVQLIITKPSVAAALPLDGVAEMDHHAKRPAQGCTLPEVGSSQLSTAIHSDLTSHLWAGRRGLCCVALQATDQRARDMAMSVLIPCVPTPRSRMLSIWSAACESLCLVGVRGTRSLLHMLWLILAPTLHAAQEARPLRDRRVLETLHAKCLQVTYQHGLCVSRCPYGLCRPDAHLARRQCLDCC